jgi:prolyl 4-hydroxylase
MTSRHRLASPLLGLLVVLAYPQLASAGWNIKSDENSDETAAKSARTTLQVPVEYGADVSFPMQHPKVSDNYAWLPHNLDPLIPTPKQYEGMSVQPLGNRQLVYDKFLQSCKDHFGRKGSRCQETEDDRVSMTLRQPQSMQNYTEVGYKKIRAPDAVYKLIKEFWDKNKGDEKLEQWGIGNTYV